MRDSYSNREFTEEELNDIIDKCTQSLPFDVMVQLRQDNLYKQELPKKPLTEEEFQMMKKYQESQMKKMKNNSIYGIMMK